MGESACYAHLLDDEGRLREPASLKLQRVYEHQPRAGAPGATVLVDRLWPRGVSKSSLADVEWAPDLAPSAELRRWFGHDPERWPEFRRRYLAELQDQDERLQELVRRARNGPLTLLYSTRDRNHNQAVVLKEAIEARL